MTDNVAQYVGVAATATTEETASLVTAADLIGWPSHVKLMNGPLASRKTLGGQPPDNPRQYPSIGQIANLMIDDPRFLNTVHFNSRDPRLRKQLGAIAGLSGLIHAIQLNILWPNPGELRLFREDHDGISLILQVSQQAYESVSEEPLELIECLKAYEGVVDYVLFDPSGGLGLAYDRLQATRLLEALAQSGLSMSWGVTGGLSADRAYGLRELLQVYPALSWDAQSNLRTGEDDQLDIEKCFGFLSASAALLR